MIKVRLAELLKDRGQNRYWLQKHTTLSPITISNIYKEKTQGIEYETLNEICKALSCQPGDLLVYVNEQQTEE